MEATKRYLRGRGLQNFRRFHNGRHNRHNQKVEKLNEIFTRYTRNLLQSFQTLVYQFFLHLYKVFVSVSYTRVKWWKKSTSRYSDVKNRNLCVFLPSSSSYSTLQKVVFFPASVAHSYVYPHDYTVVVSKLHRMREKIVQYWRRFSQEKKKRNIKIYLLLFGSSPSHFTFSTAFPLVLEFYFRISLSSRWIPRLERENQR